MTFNENAVNLDPYNTRRKIFKVDDEVLVYYKMSYATIVHVETPDSPGIMLCGLSEFLLVPSETFTRNLDRVVSVLFSGFQFKMFLLCNKCTDHVIVQMKLLASMGENK